MSIETLSDVPLFAARPSRHVAPERKATSWITVGVVHLLMLNLLYFSQPLTRLVLHGAEQETFIDLSGSHDETVPEARPVVPQAQLGTPPEVQKPPPIPLPPPMPEAPVFQQQQGGDQKGDVLGALGRDIACSAGHYENLNEAERRRCGRIPWQGAIAPSGEIVLANPARINRFAPPPPAFAMSGQDAQRLQVERAQTDCPMMLNVPCVNNVPGMRK